MDRLKGVRTAGKPLPEAMLQENPDDVRRGADNLRKQIENIAMHGVTPVVAINAFPGDFESEYQVIFDIASELGVPCAVSHHFAQGGKGAVDLAHAVVAATERPSSYAPLYPTNLPLREKIEIIARRVYGADGIDVSPLAAKQLNTFEKSGFGEFMVCIAKTHLSISSDPKLKGAPTHWRLPVREGERRSERDLFTPSVVTCVPCPVSDLTRRPNPSTLMRTVRSSDCIRAIWVTG